jgi:hypothetical protein
MTDEERTLTLAAIDAAYAAQIGKLFAVLCSASEGEFETEQAQDRFDEGLVRAIQARKVALEADTYISERLTE